MAFNVFVSWKQTSMAWAQLHAECKGQPLHIRASYPEYNRTNVADWEKVTNYDPKTFGLRIEAALERVFVPLQRFLASLQLNISILEFDQIIGEKLSKKGHVVSELLRQEGLDHIAAKLDQWKNAFLSANTGQFHTKKEWYDWINSLQLFPNWESQLEYGKFLAMLGMPQETIQKWCANVIVENPTFPHKCTSLAHLHLRWHIKAFTAFGFATSLADVAAVIMAMMNWTKKTSPTEEELVQLIDAFATRLETQSFDGLWIPDVHGLDGEKDDRLALGLIQYVRFCRNLRPAKTIWQFPPQFKDFATSFAWSGHSVFVDDDSTNAQALVKQLL